MLINQLNFSKEKVSVLIPVYRESGLLEELITSILKDQYVNKEILVVIDEPTERSRRIAEKFRGRVRFVLNGERNGKVNALREIVKLARGEVLLFLDSDVKIKAESFLSRIVEEMKNADIVELKKNIVEDSFLAKLVKYDYIGFNSANWLFSRVLGKCLGINGAAFAIKRSSYESIGGFENVISEDLDLGLKTFIKGLKFKYLSDVEVFVQIPSSWKWWITQRKRWGIGAAFWLREHYKDLVKAVKKYPQVIIPSLVLIFPSLTPFIITLLTPEAIVFNFLSTLLTLLAARFNLFFLIFIPIPMPLIIAKNLLSLTSAFATFSVIFYLIARKLKYKYSFLEFLVYYFIYSPIWLLIMLTCVLMITTCPQVEINVDWKV